MERSFCHSDIRGHFFSHVFADGYGSCKYSNGDEIHCQWKIGIRHGMVCLIYSKEVWIAIFHDRHQCTVDLTYFIKTVFLPYVFHWIAKTDTGNIKGNVSM